MGWILIFEPSTPVSRQPKRGEIQLCFDVPLWDKFIDSIMVEWPQAGHLKLATCPNASWTEYWTPGKTVNSRFPEGA